MYKQNISDYPIRDEYDIIVIGSGLGGLTCGALLAHKGYSVLIVEQFSSYGGVCQGVYRDGFIFDAAVHIAYNWPHFERIFSELGEKVEVREVRKKESIIFPEHRIVLRGISELRDQLVRIFPGEAEMIKKYYKDLVEMAETAGNLSPSELVKTGKIMTFKKYLERNTSQVVAEYFKDPKLRAIVNAAQSGYMYNYPWLFTAFYLYNTQGEGRKEYLPEFGSQEIANAFVRALRRNGGQLVLNTLVTEIVLGERNQALGVRLDDSRVIRASKAVVSNADARVTFEHLLPMEKLDKKSRELLDLWRMGGESVGYLTGFYGFDIDVGSHYQVEDDLIAYYPSYDVERMYDDIYAKNKLAPDFWLWIMFPSLTHPKMAPAGCSTAVMALPVKYGFEEGLGVDGDYNCTGLRWKGDPGKGYQRFKERISTLFKKRAEELFPGISDHVVFEELWTPLSFEKNTLNYKGSSMGWEITKEQLSRAKTMGLPLTTCFPRLYLVGNWTEAGAAAWSASASGEKVARMIMDNDQ